MADLAPSTAAPDAAGLVPSGTGAPLQAADFTNSGELKTASGDLSLVVNSARVARSFLTNSQ